MQTSRFWFGALSLLAPWSILMFIASADSDVTPTGPVSGRVTYNGRPLEGGVIYFDPIEGNSSDQCVGLIGKDGVFTIQSGWRRGQTKFRIAVIPDHWKPSTSSASRSESPQSREIVGLAAPGSENSGAHTLASVALPIPERFTNVRTSGLRATLGRDSACVDVDLKD